MPVLRIAKYERPKTVEEALATIQKSKGARVLGGGVWLRLQDRRLGCAVDLSACGLDRIERACWETGAPAEAPQADAWSIGAMVTLHQLEAHAGFNAATCGVYEAAVRDIVGVQMRNVATVGGSVFGRFGFSDILAALLPLDCEIELAGEGRVPLAEFAARTSYERDILVRVLVRDHADLHASFQCLRRSATDFSVLNVCAAVADGAWRVAVGARPSRAVLLAGDTLALDGVLAPAGPDAPAPAATMDEALSRLAANEAAALDAALDRIAAVPMGSNMRGSERYRRRLARELARRAILEAAGILAPVPETAHDPAPRPQEGASHAAVGEANPEPQPTQSQDTTEGGVA